jgi:O-antigen ligase
LSNGRLPTWLRLLLGAGAIGWLLTAATVQGSWVSGWLPPLIAILVVTILLRPRLGVALVLAGVVLTAAYYSIFYELLITQQQNEGSLGGEFGRLELWRRNLAVIQGRLLFGTGPAGYALYYTTFVPERAMSTHSNYIDTLAQFGVLGLASLLGLLASIWACGLRLLRRLEVDSDRAFCAAVTGGVAGVAASLWLGDWLLPFIYNQTIAGFDHAVYSWLMFAALCGLWAQNQTGAGRDGEA